MDFVQSLQKALNEGLDTSRDLFGKAKHKVQDLGEKGVLKFEIMQLQNQAEKLMGRLGSETYRLLKEEQQKSVKSDEESIGKIIGEIDDLREQLQAKNDELQQFEK